MRRYALALAFLTTAALASCWYPQPYPCPAIAMAPVVSLTVDADYVSAVKTVHLKACQDGSCREADLDLRPGTVAVDQGCEPGPEGSCSATVSPNGTLYGVLYMDTLTRSPIQATASGTGRGGVPLPVRRLTFTPKSNYPYGMQCGEFLSAALVLDAKGLRQA
jgi:hypothetical protein